MRTRTASVSGAATKSRRRYEALLAAASRAACAGARHSPRPRRHVRGGSTIGPSTAHRRGPVWRGSRPLRRRPSTPSRACSTLLHAGRTGHPLDVEDEFAFDGAASRSLPGEPRRPRPSAPRPSRRPRPCSMLSAHAVADVVVEQAHPTACSAAWTELTCVRMSMQYWSSSTIRCSPRTCPSIRRRLLQVLLVHRVAVHQSRLPRGYPRGVSPHRPLDPVADPR